MNRTNHKPTFQPPPPVSLRDYHKKRNKILIWHQHGGLGDALMHRMILGDFKKLTPECDLVFACLPAYHDAVKDHPDISEVLDARFVNLQDYVIHYNTGVGIADREEKLQAPLCHENRVDIWARFCGVEKINNYDMKFRLSEDVINYGKEKLAKYPKPVVVFAPVSAMAQKTLLAWQRDVILDELKDYSVVGLHKAPIKGLDTIVETHIPNWMSIIYNSDYVISVDSAAVHCAGGMRKPLMGIFTFADGDLYAKHYDIVLCQKHRKNGNWSCGPCFVWGNCPKTKDHIKPCLTELSTDELRDGIKKMFEKWPIGEIISK